MPEDQLLTIVVPTRNRPSFLLRLLTYYHSLHLDCTLLIADSSERDDLNKTRRIVNLLGSNLKVVYRSYDSDIDIYEKILDSLESVATPYTGFGADDDFFIPSTLEQGVQFLEKHHDYSVVHGYSALVTLKSGAVYGQIDTVSEDLQRTIEHPRGAERLLDFFSRYTATWYSVQRTEQLQENCRKTAALGADKYFGELLPSCLSLIQGKAKKLGDLYMVRHIHSQRTAVMEGPRDIFDWVTNPSWPGQYEHFRNYLAEALAQEDSIGLEEAQTKVKQAFWVYLADGLSINSPARYLESREPPMRERVRQKLQHVPGLRFTWRAIKSAIPAIKSAIPRPRLRDEISLPALLSAASPYYADFQPVYRAITVPPAGFGEVTSDQQSIIRTDQ